MRWTSPKWTGDNQTWHRPDKTSNICECKAWKTAVVSYPDMCEAPWWIFSRDTTTAGCMLSTKNPVKWCFECGAVVCKRAVTTGAKS